MLTQFNWCISVALCLDVQLAVSKADPILRGLARRVRSAESEPKRQLLLPPRTAERCRNCRTIAIALIDNSPAQSSPFCF